MSSEFFDPLHPAQSRIIELLAKSPRLSVQEIHKSLTKDSSVDISLPNLYRTIGLMTDAHILAKEDGKLSLNLIWIPHVLELADSIKQHYLQPDTGLSFKPFKEKERREFFADSLAALDSIWFHLIMQLGTESKSKEWYAYNAHPWHVLGVPKTELRGYESMAKGGLTTHMLYGSDTFLDQYGAKLARSKKFHISLNPKSPFPKEEYLLWAGDEYIIECILPANISERFSHFFETVRSIKEFDAELFADIFQMKVRCKITLKKDAREAKKIRETMKKYV